MLRCHGFDIADTLLARHAADVDFRRLPLLRAAYCCCYATVMPLRRHTAPLPTYMPPYGLLMRDYTLLLYYCLPVYYDAALFFIRWSIYAAYAILLLYADAARYPRLFHTLIRAQSHYATTDGQVSRCHYAT